MIDPSLKRPATPTGPEPTIPSDSDGPTTVALPLVEEQLQVSTRENVTGRVRVRTVVDVREEIVRQELDSEQVTVTRVPVDRLVESAPSIRTEGDVTIIPIVEEILIIETRLLLKEEVHIRRTSTTEIVEQPVRLRTQRAVVEGGTESE